MDLHELTISSFRKGLLEKRFSALEVTRAYLSRIREGDEKIGAFLSIFEKEAEQEASCVDERVRKGSELSLLAGVPLGVKDNFLIQGTRTTAGSKILSDYKASYDATVIRKLKGAGAVFLGKTNLDEFAMGSSTENSGFQVTRNPHNTEHVPGGSSGGSAAAVAADFALAALGSDTGGSIRQPAAFCGVAGLKPTYGAISRSGLIAMASSLDQIGLLAKTAEDAAILFSEIQGGDAYDSTSMPDALDIETLLRPNEGDVKNLTIGIPEEYFIEGSDAPVVRGVEQAIERIKSLGFKVKSVRLPHTKYALSTYYIIMPAEVSANLARFDGVRYPGIPEVEENVLRLRDLYFKTRGKGFGAEARRRILLGTFVLSAGYYDAYYAKAQKVRALIRQDFDAAFRKVDVLLTPVTPTHAFRIGEKTDNPLSMYLSDIFTVPVNLAGLPALALPVKKYTVGSGEFPVGFQLIGKRFREADILGVGRMYEGSN